MSIFYMDAAFDSNLPPTKRFILLALSDHADAAGRCYPSVHRIQKRTGLTDRAIQKNIKALIAEGWIGILKEGGRGRANYYQLRFQPSNAAPTHDENPAADAPFTVENPAADAPFTVGNPEPHAPFQVQNPEQRSENPEPRSLNPERGSPQTPRTAMEGQENEDGRASAQPNSSLSILSRLTHALGFDHRGMAPSHWVAPTAPMTVARWQRDLNLTDDEIIDVAVSSMRHYGEPANRPETLNRAMQKYAGAKFAPALEPIHQKPQETANVTPFKPSYAERRAASADDAFAARVAFAAMHRSPSRGDFGFD